MKLLCLKAYIFNTNRSMIYIFNTNRPMIYIFNTNWSMIYIFNTNRPMIYKITQIGLYIMCLHYLTTFSASCLLAMVHQNTHNMLDAEDEVYTCIKWKHRITVYCRYFIL